MRQSITDPESRKVLANEIKSLRRSNGMTQEYVAKAAGISLKTYINAERGTTISLSTTVQLQNFYEKKILTNTKKHTSEHFEDSMEAIILLDSQPKLLKKYKELDEHGFEGYAKKSSNQPQLLGKDFRDFRLAFSAYLYDKDTEEFRQRTFSQEEISTGATIPDNRYREIENGAVPTLDEALRLKKLYNSYELLNKIHKKMTTDSLSAKDIAAKLDISTDDFLNYFTGNVNIPPRFFETFISLENTSNIKSKDNDEQALCLLYKKLDSLGIDYTILHLFLNAGYNLSLYSPNRDHLYLPPDVEKDKNADKEIFIVFQKSIANRYIIPIGEVKEFAKKIREFFDFQLSTYIKRDDAKFENKDTLRIWEVSLHKWIDTVYPTDAYYDFRDISKSDL